MSTEYTNELHAGSAFQDISATLLNGERKKLATPENGVDWKMVVVYRGQHCPLCTRYLNQLESVRAILPKLALISLQCLVTVKRSLKVTYFD